MYQELLEQAKHLTQIDRRRPRQASLRRAISATYYAVFHYLIDEATKSQLGATNELRPFRRVIGRAFSHSIMKDACRSFGGGQLKEAVLKGLPLDSTGRFTVPVVIQHLASTFVELQEKRHLADYDLSEHWQRSDVLAQIHQAEAKITAFTQLPDSADRRFFLACLWAWRDLTHR